VEIGPAEVLGQAKVIDIIDRKMTGKIWCDSRFKETNRNKNDGNEH
jgi:hypothetical protein